jgi:hypothetical protein
MVLGEAQAFFHIGILNAAHEDFKDRAISLTGCPMRGAGRLRPTQGAEHSNATLVAPQNLGQRRVQAFLHKCADPVS